MFLDMQSEKAPEFKKDTVYRLKNSTHIDWKRFTTLLASRIICDTIAPLTSENRRNAFVVDDSIYERQGSKKVELLAKVYDHANHRYTRGFRMLTLGWSDGVTFLPVNSCLLSSENESSRINEGRDVDSNSNGAKVRKFAKKKATEVIPELISDAIKAGIQANYVLFDSWFSSPKVIRAMKGLGLDVVAMVKKSSKIHYCFQGQMCSCKDIFRRCKHRRGRSRYLLSVLVEICGEDAAPIAAKLVFVRNRSNRKDYFVLLSTDTSLTEDEIIQLYGKRWDIEVFFKICKSVLRLTKECRSLSYDAMCAQTAIVFTRYLFLAVGIREDSNLRSSGPLFCLAADEIADISSSTIEISPSFCWKPNMVPTARLSIIPFSYLLRLPHLMLSDILTASDSATAAMRVSRSSPSAEQVCRFSFSKKTSMPRLRSSLVKTSVSTVLRPNRDTLLVTMASIFPARQSSINRRKFVRFRVRVPEVPLSA